ncbi:hypothetical protein TBLA_0A01990 [Henningerozyma blattae CBS 6284]|uniref:Monopolar spindle protein 2 n=1 Tax=Henningerozyma blattae (strain ATCC 34711 / CBS 6284 / DSM 70876 / NBRC 10599 / NRRL Y-10934 / UCD 77-7) TaxID=1071380 RepID=I2GV48_HENB6|nr:hypothetical protein TBLA_0A01990 [Tetrapisispora blattae CBS 6284]CCH58000.1 hypothetical protein TBLA_0A01990 [Tetrapisispora blattae CBS 6284]
MDQIASFTELFDQVWLQVDSDNKDFIYASELPQFLSLLNDKITRDTGIPKRDILDPSSDMKLQGFIKEQQYFKILKNSMIRTIMNITGIDLQSQLIDLYPSYFTIVDTIPMPTVSPIRLGKPYSPSLPKSVESKNLKTLQYENNSLILEIEEKNHMIRQLKDSLIELEGKYTYLENELKYYKNNTHSKFNQLHSEVDNEEKDFLLLELKKILQEQNVLIEKAKKNNKSRLKSQTLPSLSKLQQQRNFNDICFSCKDFFGYYLSQENFLNYILPITILILLICFYKFLNCLSLSGNVENESIINHIEVDSSPIKRLFNYLFIKEKVRDSEMFEDNSSKLAYDRLIGIID